MMRRKESGFTLIELLVVVAIIGIIAGIAAARFANAPRKAREAVLMTNLATFRDVIDQYYADRGEYPRRLNDLAANAYVREIPEDPLTKSRDTWVVKMVDWELLDEGERPGIWDVRSGAPGPGLNGIEYSEW